MKLIEKVGARQALFECPMCNKHVEKRIDSGKAANTCGANACKRKYAEQSNRSLYPTSFMKVIEDIGITGTTSQHVVKYQCPHCEAKPILVISKGYKQQSCGSDNCRFKAATDTSIDSKLRLEGMDHERQLRSVFSGMKARCYNKNHKSYGDYGKKGIVVEWTDFESFKNDMFETYVEFRTNWLQNGAIKKLKQEIDREDKDGNYCKDNCRWLSKTENSARSNDEYLPIYQINQYSMKIIQTWNSAREAAAELSKIEYVDKIKNVCNGIRNEHAGFKWAWKDEYDLMLSNIDTSDPLHHLWFRDVVSDCSIGWKDFGTFSMDVGVIGKKLIKINKNEPWSASNFRWESSDYIRKDMGPKQVAKKDKKTGEVIKVYSTIKDAAADTDGASQGNISRCCAGRGKSNAGFGWEFIHSEANTDLSEPQRERLNKCIKIK